MSVYSHFALQSQSGGWARRLDARAKVAVLTVMSIAIWSVESPAGIGIIFMLCGVWLALSGAAGKNVLTGIRRLWMVFLFVVLYYLWAVYSLQGGLNWENFPEVLGRSFLLCGKLAALVATALWMYHSTPPMRVADSLTSLLRPLEKLGVPVGELGFTVGLVIRSFPASIARIKGLFGNFRRQGRLAARSGNPLRKLLTLAGAVVDTMVCYMHYTLHEAELLSLSLLARGYNPFRPPARETGSRMDAPDWTFCLVSCAVIVIAGLYL